MQYIYKYYNHDASEKKKKSNQHDKDNMYSYYNMKYKLSNFFMENLDKR